MRVKGSEWNALLKEGNTGWRRLAAALWIITGVAPGAACSRSSSPQRGHRKAAQCTSHCNRHCTKYNKKHQLNEPLKIYYSMIQSNTIYPMFQSGNIFCAVHVKLPQSVQVFICSLLFLCLPQCAVFQCSLDWQIGLADMISVDLRVCALGISAFVLSRCCVTLHSSTC